MSVPVEIIDLGQIGRLAAALVFVLALMAGLSLVMRRFSQGGPVVLPKDRRLKIVETLSLDARRRLILLKRDDREHLVILGADGETVIETGIESRQDEKHAP